MIAILAHKKAPCGKIGKNRFKKFERQKQATLRR
jgi:hypothetical protein